MSSNALKKRDVLIGSSFRSALPDVDNSNITQSLLNIEDKERSNLFPWKGQFSPQLIEAILRAHAKRGDLVLDPFMGSGTVLCEAGRLNLSAFGTEINPAAFRMASIYCFMNMTLSARDKVIRNLETKLQKLATSDLPLLARSSSQLKSGSPSQHLLALALNEQDTNTKVLLETLVALIDAGDKEITSNTFLNRWNQLRTKIKSLPLSDAKISAVNADARDIPCDDRVADLVVTSPPYINVFNYHQQYRRSMEMLGWDLLEVARSELGSNRKHRGNRFLTVTQYILDMADALKEIRRVTKKSSTIVFIVGRESNIRKTRFFNSLIICWIAELCGGYSLSHRQERCFRNRFGERIFEDLLFFRHSSSQSSLSEFDADARSIAQAVLEDARQRAPLEAQDDLADAIEQVQSVQRSPLFKVKRSLPEASAANG